MVKTMPTKIDKVSTTKHRMKGLTEIQRNLEIARLVCLPSSNLFLGFKGSGERNCTPYNLLGDRYVGIVLPFFMAPVASTDLHVVSCKSVSPLWPIQHIPTDCNEQHDISIMPSPSSSHSTYPPNVISSMTYPSSRHRCILTVVSYCATC